MCMTGQEDEATPAKGKADAGMGTLNQPGRTVCTSPHARRGERDAGTMPAGRAVWARGSGFTLLELMVVVGVVAMLFALLLPALSRLHESARRTTDLSNLRQLAAACIVYAQENDGMLPRGRAARAARPPQQDQDDYTWLSYSGCWKPLVSEMPLLDTINSCASVREGYADAGEFGKPQPAKGWADDVNVGWIYWGGRDELLGPGGVPQYRSLRRLGQRLTPGSPTLWTCWCWDSNGSARANSVCPHVGTRYIEYAPGVTLQSQTAPLGVPPPDGLGVALVDGSAAFVPWAELAIVQQANGFKLYYQP
jgi:prepilin-type N-terminal cleavage/methylation domain-containing protein